MKNHHPKTEVAGSLAACTHFAVIAACCLALVLGWGVTANAQPANDLFANRTLIKLNNGAIAGTLSNSTSEAGEPVLPGVSGGQTAWWTWIAPSNGILTLKSSATEFSPFVTVYTGETLGDLSLVASNNYLPCYVYPYNGYVTPCGCHWRMRNYETFHVIRGLQYQICVDSPLVTDSSMADISMPLTITNSDGSVQQVVMHSIGQIETTNAPPGGSLNLTLSFTPAPRNDDFARSTKLAGERTRIAASNHGATREPGEPDHDGNPGGSSIWFSWTAPASGRVTLSTNSIPPYVPPSTTGGGVIDTQANPFDCGDLEDLNPPPQFYPLLAAYTGTAVGSLTSAGCLPMGLSAYPNAVEFDAIKGQTYHIAVDGNMGTTGDLTLFLALTKPASNDLFKNRIPLHGIYDAVSGFNAGAAHETGGPTVTGSIGKNSWWTWTAPVTATVSIDLTGSDYSFPVGVFTGTSLSALALAGTGSGNVSFEAVQGVSYQIAVADLGGLTGKIKLTLQAPVVELPLAGPPLRSRGLTLLTYTASAGEMVLLQFSKDGSVWKNITLATARQNKVTFAVTSGLAAAGADYRAIIVDYRPASE